MNIPKAIANHPGVQECVDASSIGYDEEYKYNVLLKDGWEWENGRNAGGQECNFRTVAEFKYANPVQKA